MLRENSHIGGAKASFLNECGHRLRVDSACCHWISDNRGQQL